jgi:hypothetical protein
MNSVILKPTAQQLFQVQPQNSHPKLSIRRVLYAKFLRWIDKASAEALRKVTMRVGTLALFSLAYFAPTFLFGFLTAVLHWNSYRIPIFCGSLVMMLNVKRLWKLSKRTSLKSRTSNQHTYHGIPVGEFATWLIEKQAFKREDAMSKWALSQGQYAKIAEELEKQNVLMRGENNARVLREITMENLVLQLRENFPLVWSEDRQVWAERNGTFERWALSQDFKRRKLEEVTQRKERKLERVEKKIEERTTFADVMSLCG